MSCAHSPIHPAASPAVQAANPCHVPLECRDKPPAPRVRQPWSAAWKQSLGRPHVLECLQRCRPSVSLLCNSAAPLFAAPPDVQATSVAPQRCRNSSAHCLGLILQSPSPPQSASIRPPALARAWPLQLHPRR